MEDILTETLSIEDVIEVYKHKKNECIKKYINNINLNLSQLTNMIKQALNKTIDQIKIKNINIYDNELKQLEQLEQNIENNIILLYTTINDILIDVNTSNSNNIKNIQTYIEKEIYLNNINYKNEDLLKQKYNDIEKIEIQNKLLDLEFNKYNIDIFKLKVEFTTLEKVYNLRLHYSL